MRHEPGSVQLSPRERAIVRGVLRGESNKNIAGALGIQAKTVANYLHRMNFELQVANRAEMARWVLQNPGATRGETCAPGLHPPDCECGSDYCTEMRGTAAELVGRAS